MCLLGIVTFQNLHSSNVFIFDVLLTGVVNYSETEYSTNSSRVLERIFHFAQHSIGPFDFCGLVRFFK